MLSYQHSYHAGNAADVHKHAALCVALAYMTRKDKALSYLESHAGRGLYDLGSAAAARTGEAAQGAGRLLDRFAPDHPYRRALDAIRRDHGGAAYPGSPLLAQRILRRFDRIDLAELHPAEHAALVAAMPASPNTRIHHRDGIEMVKALTPPDPRRGLMLVDPSWEIRSDYQAMARLLPAIHRKWGVGVLMLWYPILADDRHVAMVETLGRSIPGLFRHEVRFPPARAGHGMRGSGLVVVNPPWDLERRASELSHVFEEDE
ncbi:23S rRNA (adenine(2030)-N(6))-methyltransferase RlmJ [Jannaschia sp. S6380]|uniref:23S rRNA (adenine(2030)-N(6))-methyltransferase RlmJ n=1 Tax=Jannaschia sp. S6380 TaxID=2926408 RepID=UPI001FF2C829|nr:23S rRNA (adenine(2030)-N(6))-methyltransferase RlmJ [Jannaschia sp. S6380]MCK0167787.1 23S rRNA (adenine(2030)-N(6))-methyltransferase RlmJ [Jannaschia sp. S6380]